MPHLSVADNITLRSSAVPKVTATFNWVQYSFKVSRFRSSATSKNDRCSTQVVGLLVNWGFAILKGESPQALMSPLSTTVSMLRPPVAPEGDRYVQSKMPELSGVLVVAILGRPGGRPPPEQCFAVCWGKGALRPSAVFGDDRHTLPCSAAKTNERWRSLFVQRQPQLPSEWEARTVCVDVAILGRPDDDRH